MSPTSKRNALVEEHRPLAAQLARRYRSASEPLEDLTQVAYLGLVLAADRYSPEHGSSFKSFAIPTILGELRRHLRDHAWAVRMPRGLQEDVLRVTKVVDDLGPSVGRAPTPREIAREAGFDESRVVDAMKAASAFASDSLDRQPAGDGDERESLVATIGDVDSRYEFIDEAVSMRPAIAKLSARERTVLAMRFFDDLTQSEIATRLGVSQMQISRLLRGALESLHDATRAPDEATTYRAAAA